MTDTLLPPQNAMAANLVWPKFGYQPHPGQLKIHEATARNRLASCGRRFGKSKLGGSELVPLALHTFLIRHYLKELDQQKRIWVVGPNYDDDEKEFRVFWNACKRLQMPLDRPGSYYSEEAGNMQVSLWDGAFHVECRSAAHPESLDGEGLDKVLLVEAAKLKSSVWNKFIRPALADKRGEALLTSTPEGKNWYYDFYKKGQDPNEPEWWSIRMPSWKNTTIFPGGKEDPEILSMKADMSDEFFNQEVAALFTDFVGRVFKRFEEEIHVVDLEYDPRLPLYACCDYGWTNPFVWLLIQIDVWDNVYVLGEYRTRQMTNKEIAKDLASWRGGISKLVQCFYPDPAEPGDTRELEEELRIKANSNTGGELKDRLDLIRTWLKPVPEHVPEGDRLPKLFIDRSCTGQPLGDGGLIREMYDYRYPDNAKKNKDEKNESEKPMDKDDHGPEALGRFFKGHIGIKTKTRARTKKANYTR